MPQAASRRAASRRFPLLPWRPGLGQEFLLRWACNTLHPSRPDSLLTSDGPRLAEPRLGRAASCAMPFRGASHAALPRVASGAASVGRIPARRAGIALPLPNTSGRPDPSAVACSFDASACRRIRQMPPVGVRTSSLSGPSVAYSSAALRQSKYMRLLDTSELCKYLNYVKST